MPLFMARERCSWRKKFGRADFFFLSVCTNGKPQSYSLVAIEVWHAHSLTVSFSCLHHLRSSPPKRHNGPVQSDPYLPNNTWLWKDPYQVAANAPVGPREWKMLPAETAWVSGPCEQKAVWSSERKGEIGEGGAEVGECGGLVSTLKQ